MPFVPTMSQVSTPGHRILIILSSGVADTQTLDYGIREARDSAAELETPIGIDVWIAGGIEETTAARQTKSRIENLLSAVEGPELGGVNVEFLQLTGADSLDRTEEVLESSEIRNFSRVILTADTGLLTESLREQLGVSIVELAPSKQPRRRRELLLGGGTRKLITVFGLTFLFYLAIGGFSGGADFVTGAISAGVVSLMLAHLSFEGEPTFTRTGRRVVRMAMFLPVLLWEITKANFVIAYILLHPGLPIDPAIGIYDTETREGLERMVLANSITLTPGTLTVDVREGKFTIHALTSSAFDELEAGRINRLVRWVFHGKSPVKESEDKEIG